VMLWAT